MPERKTKEQFIEEATSIHGHRYNYDQVVYITYRTPVTIVCAIHGPFQRKPVHHIYDKRGCPECIKAETSQDKTRYTTETFVQKALQIHGRKYNYEDVLYERMHSKIIVLCNDHGSFSITPSDHLHRKVGCPQCSGKVRSTKDEFIEAARQVHGDIYDYAEVNYVNSGSKVDIRCRVHGTFLQTPNHHVSQKQGCPKCAKIGYSRKALEWLDNVAKQEQIYIQHALNDGEFVIPGTRYRADGYCVETNTIYEFHGDDWHGNPNKYQGHEHCHPIDPNITANELLQRTIEKEQLITSRGYNLVTMWESEYDKLIGEK